MNPLNYFFVEQIIWVLIEKKIIVDTDVAQFCGVQTKHVIQAVKNNPQKFPPGYITELYYTEYSDLRSKAFTKKLSYIFWLTF